MIYYTLLPEDEIRTLRKEYRIRLLITMIFFLSCIFLFGIFSLMPSYLFFYNKEDRAIEIASELEKGRIARGADIIEKELKDDNKIIKKVLSSFSNTSNHSELIQNILSNRNNGILINSFNVSKDEGTSTPIEIEFQGKASTREVLIAFKDGLEKERNFSKVELPVSDLAKSKDISFSIRLTSRTKEEMMNK